MTVFIASKRNPTQTSSSIKREFVNSQKNSGLDIKPGDRVIQIMSPDTALCLPSLHSDSLFKLYHSQEGTLYGGKMTARSSKLTFNLSASFFGCFSAVWLDSLWTHAITKPFIMSRGNEYSNWPDLFHVSTCSGDCRCPEKIPLDLLYKSFETVLHLYVFAAIALQLQYP